MGEQNQHWEMKIRSWRCNILHKTWKKSLVLLPSDELHEKSHLTLLNCSRDKEFISTILKILESSKLPLRKKVVLKSSKSKSEDKTKPLGDQLL